METLNVLWNLFCSFIGIVVLIFAAYLIFNGILVWHSFGSFLGGIGCIFIALIMFCRTN